MDQCIKTIRKRLQKCLICFISLYEKLIIHTCTVSYCGDYNGGEAVIGFWHGDSFLMYLALHYFNTYEIKPCVIVTADSRGDIIESIIVSHNAYALRVQDGFGMRHMYRSIIEEVKKKDSVMVISLDGPLGPNHIPKKLSMSLAQKANKNLYVTTIESKGIIRCKWRWDNYGILLPFSKVQLSCKLIENER